MAARAVPITGQLVSVFTGVGVTDPPDVEGPPQAAKSSARNISELMVTKRRGQGECSSVFMICLLSSFDRRTIS
jgi:hypothetical protein